MQTAQSLNLFDSPLTIVADPTVKTIKWPVNFNNKMGNKGFIHIDLAPAQKPVRSKVESQVIRIYTADGSHPPVDKFLFDILFLPLYKIPCWITMASHGMDENEFREFIINKYSGRVSLETELAVYYYKKGSVSI